MPITDLRKRGLTTIAHLRKGEASGENEIGRDLDYFRFDPEGDEEQAERIRRRFYDAYPNQPREIHCFLASSNLDEAWEHWYEAYVSGGLVRRCDGDTIVLEREAGESAYSDEPRPCQKPGCDCYESPTGRLHVIIPELSEFGDVVVHTGSIHDIANITEYLQRIVEIAEHIRIPASWIPLVLRRRPMKITRPDPKHGRVRQTSWLITIRPQAEFFGLYLDQAQRAAFRQLKENLLALGQAEGDKARQLSGPRLLSREQIRQIGPAREGASSEGSPSDIDPGEVEWAGDDEASAGEKGEATDPSTGEIEMGAPEKFTREAVMAGSDFGFDEATRDLRLQMASEILTRQIETFKELTEEECHTIVAAFEYAIKVFSSAADRIAFARWVVAEKPRVSSGAWYKEAIRNFVEMRTADQARTFYEEKPDAEESEVEAPDAEESDAEESDTDAADDEDPLAGTFDSDFEEAWDDPDWGNP